MKYIRESKSICKKCYRCLKNCMVKSIKFEGEDVSVIDEQCILCGLCITSCPQYAKHARQDLIKVLEYIDSPKFRTVVSLAPSYVAAFGKNSKKIINALKILGFDDVEETAVGAQYVTQEYIKLIEEGKMDSVITSSCSSANLLVRKYYPGLTDMLAPVLSPVLAHGKILKEKYGPDTKVIFVGPCLSKIQEIDENPRYVDGAVSFDSLIEWLRNREINIERFPDEEFYNTPFSAIYPIFDGINIDIKRKMNISGLSAKVGKYDILAVSGIKELRRAFDEIKTGKLKNVFIEANVCRGGCINGPLMPEYKNLSVYDRIEVVEHAQKGKIQVDGVSLKFSRSFEPEKIENNMPSEDEIKRILKKIGKDEEFKQLNCGSCGYPTCREKAIAVYQKRADLYMCLPYMNDINQTMASTVLSVTPNYIIAVDENLKIREFNVSAQKLFNISRSDAISRYLGEFIDPSDFEHVLKTKKNINDKKVKYEELGIVTKQYIIYTASNKMAIGILYDITDEEKYNEMNYSLKMETVLMAQKVIDKQMTVAQQIASLLGETTAETKVTLNRIKRLMEDEGTDINEL